MTHYHSGAGRQRDANEATIVIALRAMGASVQLLSETGVPDLLVGYRGVTYLIEVKNPDDNAGAKKGGKRTKGRGALTPDQVEWFEAWNGRRVYVVINADEAMVAIGALRRLRRVG